MSSFDILESITKKIGSGATPRGGNTVYCSKGISLIRSQNVLDLRFKKKGLVFINDEQAEKLKGVTVENNDILLNITGDSIARCCLVPDNVLPARVNQHVSIIRCKEKESADYVNYYLQYLKPYLLKICGVGGTRNALTKEAIDNLKINLLSDHKNRAKILTTLDKKIELNNRINTELESMAKMLYDYWFVQFDFPNEQSKPYKSSGGKMVFNETLKREIPEGWIQTKLGSILKTKLGGTPSTKINEYWNGDIPWLNSGEIANFPIIEAEEHITSSAINNSATSLMPKGTSVLSITRHLRPSILAVDACANQSVVGILASKELKSSYIYPYLKNEIPRLMSLRTGAQQPHINKGIVDASLIIFPTDDILQIYYEKVDAIFDKIYNVAFQNQQLTQLRNWLLPMLMNGQVTVNNNAKKQ